jgi:hypothetical protein
MPNTSAMRLATYRIDATQGGDPVDVSVSRAGGTPDANVQRWMAQFDDPHETQANKHVSGMDIALIEVTGTYRGGGMMAGQATTPHPDWTLLAAIAPVPTGASYFFRLLGPSSEVRRARPAFDALVDSFKQPR